MQQRCLRQSSVLLNKVKLKQGTDIEQAADRVTNIANQITGLEEKEVELAACCDQLYQSGGAQGICRSVDEAEYQATREVLNLSRSTSSIILIERISTKRRGSV